MTPRAWLVLAAMGAIAAAVVLLPPLLPYAPEQPDFTAPLLAPCRAHLFGTDDLGRDVLARVLAGGRVSLGLAAVSVGGAVLVGVPFGLASGFVGGWIDRVAVRVIDLMLAFPSMLLALGLASTLGGSLGTAALAVFATSTPVLARIARSQAGWLRNQDYIGAALVAGCSEMGILSRHITPNAAGPVLVQASGQVAGAMLMEATLSFLGLGIQPPQPSWGGMLRDATGFLQQAPWLAWFPGLALSLSALCITIIGDMVRDNLDPRQ